MKISREYLISKLQEILGKIPTKFYADLLFDSTSKFNLHKSASGEKIIANLKNRGIVFRIFDGRIFHEISTSLSEVDLLEQKITKMVASLEYSPKVELISLPAQSLNQEITNPNFQDFTQISLEEKRTQIQNFYDIMGNSDADVINPEIIYFDMISEKIYVNTEGSVLRQKIPRIGITLKPIVKSEKKIDYDKLSLFGEKGFELLDQITPEIIENLVISSKELATAPLAPTGVIPVITDPSISGALAHAIFGHGVQADQILRGRSMWKQYYQKAVASDIVNISDSADVSNLYGSYSFDDEGVFPKKSKLVENGILTNYLHSRYTASILGMPDQLSGNGRRQDFNHPLYPRNSNTYFEPGTHKLEEMIEDLKYGVIVHNLDFGMEDPISGAIQCNSRYGYLVENGEKVKKIKQVALSGDSLIYLQSIDAISSNNLNYEGYDSRKGREDIVPVSFGGPYLKINRAIVGPG